MARKRLVTEAEAIHHAGPKILHDDIGLRDQPVNELDRIGALQVQREASLARIELTEIGAVSVAQGGAQPHVVAFRRLDLDDLGADIGKQSRTIGAGQHDREIEHAHAFERRRPGIRFLHIDCSYLGSPSPRCAIRFR